MRIRGRTCRCHSCKFATTALRAPYTHVHSHAPSTGAMTRLIRTCNAALTTVSTYIELHRLGCRARWPASPACSTAAAAPAMRWRASFEAHSASAISAAAQNMQFYMCHFSGRFDATGTLSGLRFSFENYRHWPGLSRVSLFRRARSP
eukprot:3725579-Pleurochrysis_carterae.AAC.2